MTTTEAQPMTTHTRPTSLRGRRASVTMAEIRRHVEDRLGVSLSEEDVINALRAVQVIDGSEQSGTSLRTGRAALEAVIEFLEAREEGAS